MRNKQQWDFSETESEAQQRMKRFDAEKARTARNNELLSAPTITLGAIKEIAASQQDSASEHSASETSQSAGHSAECTEK